MAPPVNCSSRNFAFHRCWAVPIHPIPCHPQSTLRGPLPPGTTCCLYRALGFHLPNWPSSKSLLGYPAQILEFLLLDPWSLYSPWVALSLFEPPQCLQPRPAAWAWTSADGSCTVSCTCVRVLHLCVCPPPTQIYISCLCTGPSLPPRCPGDRHSLVPVTSISQSSPVLQAPDCILLNMSPMRL